MTAGNTKWEYEARYGKREAIARHAECENEIKTKTIERERESECGLRSIVSQETKIYIHVLDKT